MSARNILMAAGGSADDKLYVDDVFSAYTYTGNGSTQTINNGIDLAGKGGMVWTKSRSTASTVHALYDTVRGAGRALYSSSAEAQNASADLSSFNSNGFSLANVAGQSNWNGQNYISCTFRKAAKFFDVVTYTGNDTWNSSVSHTLNLVPGLVIVKALNSTSSWYVWHRNNLQSGYPTPNSAALDLSTSGQQHTNNNNFDYWGSSAYTATTFSVGPINNTSGVTYVAYLFAHDPSADGIIQCGSFTTDGSGNATVNHGWAKGVQFALLKASSTTGDWEMFDTARTAGWSGSDARLRANLSAAEDSVFRLSASGTSVSFTGLTAGATYIYMFIVNP